MKTRMNILTLACALTCFSCIGTAHTIQPSKNYQTEKRSLGDIREVSTLSSIDVVYHQTSGSPYAEIYASDNVMPYVVLKESKGELRVYYQDGTSIQGESKGELRVYYQDGTSIQGENRCRVDVYAPSVSRFTTMASGDISIPKGLKTQGDIRFQTNASGDIECPTVQCSSFQSEINASGDIDVQQVNCQKLQAGINASGDMTVHKAVCQHASLTINASGDLMVPNLQCQEVVTATVNASGDMVIKGSCQEAVLRDNASGDLSADNLKAVKVDAAVYGSGDLSCRASRSITAKTYGSGSISYTGNPSQVVTEGKHIYKK